MDGFDQDEAESKRDERAVILRRLLASKCDTLEAFEFADRLFDACPSSPYPQMVFMQALSRPRSQTASDRELAKKGHGV